MKPVIETIERVTKRLADDPNVVFAFVFGSMVTAIARPPRDLDIDAYFNEPPRGIVLLTLVNHLSEASSFEVDLIVLNSAPALLRHQVLRHGQCLFKRDSAQNRDFRVQAMEDYDIYRHLANTVPMIDKLIIEGKLKSIERYIAELERESFGDLESFRKDIIRKRFVERNLVLAVEKMINVCKHIISVLDMREPETYADCFRILGDAGVVQTTDLETFQNMARFRDLLIHGYKTVEDEITYNILTTRLDDFRLFCKTIRE